MARQKVSNDVSEVQGVKKRAKDCQSAMFERWRERADEESVDDGLMQIYSH